MTQPELPADAPVADVAHPGEVDIGVAAGVEDYFAALGGRNPGCGEGGHAHPPLLAHQRLEHRAAAVAVADLVQVLLFLVDDTERATRLGDSSRRMVGQEGGDMRWQRAGK